MINTDDKLRCTKSNHFYSEGEIYKVGRIVNNKYFQILTDNDADHWYATLDDRGIYVSFDSNLGLAENERAYFEKIDELKAESQQPPELFKSTQKHSKFKNGQHNGRFF